ncbi:MAG: aldo/keto reductase [Lysinibacillus sp.]
MKFRTLGQSDLHISEMSLGTMSLPMDITEAKYIIDAALDAGINYIDTADLYDDGVNEQIVGQAVKEKREHIILATKVGNRLNTNGEGWHWDASPSYIQEAVKASLKRLQTDYIDVYQLHGGTIDDDLPAVIDTFEQLKKQGYIRHYGISSIRPNVFVPFLQNSKAVSNMMQYNVLDRCAEEFFDSIQATGASVVTRGSIAKGLLSSQWRQRLKPYMTYDQNELKHLLETLEDHYGSIHSAALAWNLQHDVIASTVIGARTKEQLAENLTAYEKISTLPSTDFISQNAKVDHYKDHR